MNQSPKAPLPPNRKHRTPGSNEKSPIVTGHDNRFHAPTGGRSDPGAPTAPDGISGNWS